MSKVAHILAVDAARLPSMGSGFFPIGEALTLDRLNKAGLFIGPRQMLEEDERFRQIIPYVVLRQGPDFIGYVRGASGGEARLHGKISIGAGGHIDFDDVISNADSSINLADTLNAAATRELDEELHFHDLGRSYSADEPKWVGLLVDDSDPVGRVHIGVVGVIDTPFQVETKEDSQQELDSFSIDDLRQNQDRLEGWTALLLPSLQQLVDSEVSA